MKELEDAGDPGALPGRGAGPRLGARGSARWSVSAGSTWSTRIRRWPRPARGSRSGGGRPRRVYTEHNVWARYHPATYWANLLTFPRNDHVFAVSEHVRGSIRYPGALRASADAAGRDAATTGSTRTRSQVWARVDGVREELGIAARRADRRARSRTSRTHKRLDRMLRAAAIVRRAHPDVRFVIVGSGPMEAGAPAPGHAARPGRDGAVHWASARTRQRIAAVFDVFALSSEHEGLSIALIEAMALGKPAVVHRRRRVCREVVRDGREGLLVRSCRCDRAR